MQIGLIQMRCEKGAINENLETMARVMDEAKKREIDILAFPEMCITGYADPNKYPHAILRLDGPEIARFLSMTRGLDATVLAGLIEENRAAGDGLGTAPARPYITHIAARDGKMLGYYRKVTIVDNETKWFSPGDTVPVFQRDGWAFGIAICADAGNAQVFAECARQGARIVFELAAPGLYGEQATRNWQSGFDWWRSSSLKDLSSHAKNYGLWIAEATQAGRTVDEDFPGGALVVAPDGSCLFATPDWQAGEVWLDLDMKPVGGTVRVLE
jgi:predicted amidohydrolase